MLLCHLAISGTGKATYCSTRDPQASTPALLLLRELVRAPMADASSSSPLDPSPSAAASPLSPSGPRPCPFLGRPRLDPLLLTSSASPGSRQVRHHRPLLGNELDPALCFASLDQRLVLPAPVDRFNLLRGPRVASQLQGPACFPSRSALLQICLSRHHWPGLRPWIRSTMLFDYFMDSIFFLAGFQAR